MVGTNGNVHGVNGSRRSCFGFTVSSRHEFQFLRDGAGRDTLEIVHADRSLAVDNVKPLVEWTLSDPNADVAAKLYEVNGVFHFWTSDAGWYRIDPRARRIEMSDHCDEIRGEQRLWGIPTALCMKDRGDLVLHAAAVEVGGSALLLAAPGRYGKTTLAVAFHRNGYRLLSEDTACCSVAAEPILFPGPACVRLRPDMFDGQAPRGTTVAAVRSDRIHLTLDPSTRGDGKPLPIRAVVFLREASDQVSLETLSASDSLPDLWTLTLRLRTDAERRRSFTQVARLAAQVPIWNLHRPLQASTLDSVVARLVDTCCK